MPISCKILFAAILFALSSSLRITYLPEIQLLLIVFFLVKARGINFHAAILIVIVFCTHHFAIPDSMYRFNSGGYPSIYTKSYGPIKILDILTCVLLAASISNIKKIKYIFTSKKVPAFLLFTSLLGIFFISYKRLDISMLFFLLRSYILAIFIFVLFYDFNRMQLYTLAKTAIVSWIAKMFFAILISHPSPLTRNILGEDGIIYFAGDEYLTIGIYIAIILITKYSKKFSFHRLVKFILITVFVLLLALTAQRKGAIPYCLFIILMLFATYFDWHKILNFILALNPWLVFIFVIFIVPHLSELLSLAFREQTAVAESAVSSIAHTFNNPIHAVTGISPIGLYEIINLPQAHDHEFAFGAYTGEKYRYIIWTFPEGRLILNAGLLGFITIILYKIKAIFTMPVPMFYIFVSILPFFYYASITPVSSIAVGIAMVVFFKSSCKLL